MMIKTWILIAVMIAGVHPVFSQDDDTIQFNQGLPVSGEDSAQPVPQDMPPADSVVKISVEQVPEGLYETLNSEPQFNGWQKQVIELDKNTKMYWLHMKNNNILRSYGFNAEGDPVSFKEKTLSAEQ